MRETKIYCDHCKKELDEMKDYTDTAIDVIAWCKVDLCQGCAKEISNIVLTFCGKEGVKENA